MIVLNKERLTKRVDDIVIFNGGIYKGGIIAAEMNSTQVREVLRKLADYEDLNEVPHNSNQLYNQVIESYGQDAQMIVAMEECSELIQAISKHLRGRETNLEEEIADVEIMLEQLKLMCNQSLVEEFKASKLQRLEQRLSIRK